MVCGAFVTNSIFGNFSYEYFSNGGEGGEKELQSFLNSRSEQLNVSYFYFEERKEEEEEKKRTVEELGTARRPR